MRKPPKPLMAKILDELWGWQGSVEIKFAEWGGPVQVQRELKNMEVNGYIHIVAADDEKAFVELSADGLRYMASMEELKSLCAQFPKGTVAQVDVNDNISIVNRKKTNGLPCYGDEQ